MSMRIILTTLAIVVTVLLAGCGGSDSSDDRMDVVAAFYPLAYAAEQTGGDSVSVTNVTPPGTEPHDVELSPRDVERVRSADLVLYLGSGFQPALERAVKGGRGDALDLLDGTDTEPGPEGTLDPHVWLDPIRFAAMVERIGEALKRPEAADALATRLRRLDADFRAGLANCARDEIVTSHAAFGYMARRYGLEQIALTGISPEAEPSARELERVINEVRKRKATTVFFETLVSPRLAETVAREAGARTDVLNPLEGLTEEELSRGENYFTVMREDLAVLRQALGCR
jgi:zinc transport system substrate-binding protein